MVKRLTPSPAAIRATDGIGVLRDLIERGESRGRRGLPLIENRHFCSVAKPSPC
jgi:hypothetical protein